MAKGLVTQQYLSDIADAIREKNGTETEYLPSEMAAAVAAIPNSYAASDEGKIVKNGALVAQTARATEIAANGTYDTTENNSVTVNVSGGGGAVVQPLNVTQNGTYNPPSGVDGYAPVTVNVQGGGKQLDPDHTYYNGYLLPTLPEVQGYPYVWIRKNEQTGYFDALYGKSVWYSNPNDPINRNADNWLVKTNEMPDCKWYRVTIQNASEQQWEAYTVPGSSSMGTNSGRDIFWTNEDILYDSPTATGVILIKGYPVPSYV